MDHCIDIFSRLIIATITFVVPIIINLLSTFTAGEKRRKELANQSQDDVGKRALEEVQINPEKVKETITKTSEEYKKIEETIKNDLKLLNPLRQFWIIFSFLVISLIMLLLSYLIRSNSFNLYNHTLSIVVLLLSIMSYITSLGFIIRVLYTISKTRKIIDGI